MSAIETQIKKQMSLLNDEYAKKELLESKVKDIRIWVKENYSLIDDLDELISKIDK